MHDIQVWLHSIFTKPLSMPWQDDPDGILHRLFWNEHASDPAEGIYRILGVVHLYSSSGIHLYAFLQTTESVLYPLSRKTGIPITWLKRIAWGIALAILCWAWFLQSFRPGFARPVVTFFIRQWARHLGARARILAPLFITLVFDAVLDFGGGRVHYYLAIAGGLLAMEWLRDLRKKKRVDDGPFLTHVALSVGSWVMTAPVDLIESHRISWMTPIFSLLTLPVLSLFLYPVSVLSLMFTDQIHPVLLFAWRSIMDAQLGLADCVPGPIRIESMAMIFGLLGASAALAFRRRIRSLIFISILMIVISDSIPRQNLVAQLNVKQGDALLIHRFERTEMIDAGPDFGLRSSDWVDRMYRYSVDEIDAVLLTHLDQDHWTGLKRLLRFAHIHCIEVHARHQSSEQGKIFIEWMKRDYPWVKIQSTNCFKVGKVEWFATRSGQASGNNLMAGVAIPISEEKIYLAAGDSDQDQERQYLKVFGQQIREFPDRIWKLSHHGSKYSSDLEVLRKLRPGQVWLSSGKKNPYHHPHMATLKRLEILEKEMGGIDFQRTDANRDLIEKISQPSRSSTFWNWLLKKSKLTGFWPTRSLW